MSGQKYTINNLDWVDDSDGLYSEVKTSVGSWIIQSIDGKSWNVFEPRFAFLGARASRYSLKAAKNFVEDEYFNLLAKCLTEVK